MLGTIARTEVNSMSKVVERFTIGGINRHPSMPSTVLQKALGSTIRINIEDHTLIVPTQKGYKVAYVGDTVIRYDDGMLDVEYQECKP